MNIAGRSFNARSLRDGEQPVPNYLMWVLETNFWSSAGAATLLTMDDLSSPAPPKQILMDLLKLYLKNLFMQN